MTIEITKYQTLSFDDFHKELDSAIKTLSNIQAERCLMESIYAVLKRTAKDTSDFRSMYETALAHDHKLAAILVNNASIFNNNGH